MFVCRANRSGHFVESCRLSTQSHTHEPAKAGTAVGNASGHKDAVIIGYTVSDTTGGGSNGLRLPPCLEQIITTEAMLGCPRM